MSKDKANNIKATNDLLSTDGPTSGHLKIDQKDVHIINRCSFNSVPHYGVIIKIPGTDRTTIGWIPASLFASTR